MFLNSGITTKNTAAPQSSVANTSAENATPVPVAYGRVKLPVHLIARTAPYFTDYMPRAQSTAYYLGDRVTNGGNIYECAQSGTTGTGAGPTATSGNLLWVGDQRATIASGVQTYNAPGAILLGMPGYGLPFGCDGCVWDFEVGGYLIPTTGTPDYTGRYYEVGSDGTYIFNFPDARDVSVAFAVSAASSPIADGAVLWSYVQALPFQAYLQQFAAALCEGQVIGATALWWDKLVQSADSATRPGRRLTLHLGLDAGGDGTVDLGTFPHTALISTDDSTYGPFTGTQTDIPDIAVELLAVQFGSSTDDVSPADIINDLLTHTRRGAGWSSAKVGSSVTGTATGGFRVYCDACGFRFSAVIDSETSILDVTKQFIGATNSDAYWSAGTIKVQPRGDQSIAAPVYGATGYVPTNTAQYDLGVDDFLDKVDPVQMQRRSAADCFNAWPVQYVDRSLGYQQNTIEDPEPIDVDARGILRAGTTDLGIIMNNGTAATVISRILAQRSVNNRNTYTFKLGWRYCLLEATDIVTLTEPALGLSLTPVRITSITDNGDAGLTVTAEDYPAGTHAAASHRPARGDGYIPNEQSIIAHLRPNFDYASNISAAGMTADLSTAIPGGGGGDTDVSGILSLASVWSDLAGQFVSIGVGGGSTQYWAFQAPTTGYYTIVAQATALNTVHITSGLLYLRRYPANSGSGTTLLAKASVGTAAASVELAMPLTKTVFLNATDVVALCYEIMSPPSSTTTICCAGEKTFFTIQRLK